MHGFIVSSNNRPVQEKLQMARNSMHYQAQSCPWVLSCFALNTWPLTSSPTQAQAITETRVHQIAMREASAEFAGHSRAESRPHEFLEVHFCLEPGCVQPAVSDGYLGVGAASSAAPALAAPEEVQALARPLGDEGRREQQGSAGA